MVFNPDITAVDPSQFFERLAEGRVASARLRNVGEVVRLIDEPGQAARLLRMRRERPRRRSAAEQRDELPPLQPRDHSITSSARASNVAGTSRRRALAVIRLMTRSNLVGCSTGISAAFVPRKILSTKSAARRCKSGRFGP